MLITDVEVQAAQDQADAAARELATADAAAVRRTGPLDDDAASAMGWAMARSRQATARLDQLLQARAEQRRLLEARAAKEEKAAPALAKEQRELEAAWTAMLGHVAGGRLPESLATAGMFNAELAGTHALLVRLGLLLSDVDESVDHATGAGERGAARLRGRFWRPVDPATVAVRMVLRHLLATVDPRHMTVQRLRPLADVDPGANSLFAEVPPLAAFVGPGRRRPPSPVYERPPGRGGKPFLEQERQLTPTPGWKEAFVKQYGVDPDGAA